MDVLGVTPDTITFTSLINACSKAQQLEKAFEVIDCMRTANIAPNIFTYTTLIGAEGDGRRHRGAAGRRCQGRRRLTPSCAKDTLMT